MKKLKTKSYKREIESATLRLLRILYAFQLVNTIITYGDVDDYIQRVSRKMHDNNS